MSLSLPYFRKIYGSIHIADAQEDSMRLAIRSHILVVVCCHLICILDGEAILVSSTKEEHIPILQGDAKVAPYEWSNTDQAVVGVKVTRNTSTQGWNDIDRLQVKRYLQTRISIEAKKGHSLDKLIRHLYFLAIFRQEARILRYQCRIIHDAGLIDPYRPAIGEERTE